MSLPGPQTLPVETTKDYISERKYSEEGKQEEYKKDTGWDNWWRDQKGPITADSEDEKNKPSAAEDKQQQQQQQQQHIATAPPESTSTVRFLPPSLGDPEDDDEKQEQEKRDQAQKKADEAKGRSLLTSRHAESFFGDQPEFSWYRDISFLAQCCLRPGFYCHLSQSGVKSDLAPSNYKSSTPNTLQHVQPRFVQKDGRHCSAHSSAGTNHWPQSYCAHYASALRKLHYLFRHDTNVCTHEEQVLYLPEGLNTMDDNLSVEESEALVAMVLVPNMRIPLILSFAAAGRSALLFNRVFQSLLQGVLFEPGASKHRPVDADPATDSDTVPVARERMGSHFGLLDDELVYAPRGVLCPLLQLISEVVELASPSAASLQSSTTAQGTFFALMLGAQLSEFAEIVVRRQEECGSIRELMDLLPRLQELVFGTGIRLLQKWFEIMLVDGDKQSTMTLAAHILRLLSLRPGGLSSSTFASASANMRTALRLSTVFMHTMSLPDEGGQLVSDEMVVSTVRAVGSLSAEVVSWLEHDQGMNLSGEGLEVVEGAIVEATGMSFGAGSIWKRYAPGLYHSSIGISFDAWSCTCDFGSQLRPLPAGIVAHDDFLNAFPDKAPLCVELDEEDATQADGQIERRRSDFMLYDGEFVYKLSYHTEDRVELKIEEDGSGPVRRIVRPCGTNEVHRGIVLNDATFWWPVFTSDHRRSWFSAPISNLTGACKWQVQQQQQQQQQQRTEAGTGAAPAVTAAHFHAGDCDVDFPVRSDPDACTSGYNEQIARELVKNSRAGFARHTTKDEAHDDQPRWLEILRWKSTPEDASSSQRAQVHVPTWKLAAYLPAILLQHYSFWHEQQGFLVGTPLTITPMLPVGGRHKEARSTTQREPAQLGFDYEIHIEHLRFSDQAVVRRGDEVLLNPTTALEKSDQSGYEDDDLQRLAATMSRFEDLSHVLFWGLRLGGQRVRLKSIELPRIGMTFVAIDEPLTGRMSMRLRENPSLGISSCHLDHDDGLSKNVDSAAGLLQLVAGLPSYLLLEDVGGTLHVCVPTADIEAHPTNQLSSCPLLRRRWASVHEAPTIGYFRYEIHAARQTLLCRSRPAALYLFALYLHGREYAQAVRLVDVCSVDIPLASDDQWCLELIAATAETDCSPQACACRLSLWEAAHAHTFGSSGSPESPMKPLADALVYFQSRERVPVEVRLCRDSEVTVIEQLVGMVASQAGAVQAEQGLQRRTSQTVEQTRPANVMQTVLLREAGRLRLQEQPVVKLAISGWPTRTTSMHAGGGWHRCKQEVSGVLTQMQNALKNGRSAWELEENGKGFGIPNFPCKTDEAQQEDTGDGRDEGQAIQRKAQGILHAVYDSDEPIAGNSDLEFGLIYELLSLPSTSPSACSSSWAQLLVSWFYCRPRGLLPPGHQHKPIMPVVTLAVLAVLCEVGPSMAKQLPIPRSKWATWERNRKRRDWEKAIVKRMAAHCGTQRWELLASPFNCFNPAVSDRKGDKELGTRRLRVSNSARASVTLMKSEGNGLQLDDLTALADQPLHRWLAPLTTSAASAPLTTSTSSSTHELPFSTEHAEMRTDAGTKLLGRLREELRQYRTNLPNLGSYVNTDGKVEKATILPDLPWDELKTWSRNTMGVAKPPPVSEGILRLHRTEAALRAARQEELARVQHAIKWLEQTVNPDLIDDSTFETVEIALRFAGKVQKLTIKDLCSVLMSTNGKEELQEAIGGVQRGIVPTLCGMMLCCSRFSQLQRALVHVKLLLRDLGKLFLLPFAARGHSEVELQLLQRGLLQAAEGEEEGIRAAFESDKLEGVILDWRGRCEKLAQSSARTVFEVRAAMVAAAGVDELAEGYLRTNAVCSLLPEMADESPSELYGSLFKEADALLDTLSTRRYYASVGGGQEVTLTLDPRLLVFEHASSFMLRQRQVQMVKDFAREATRGQSSVRQLLMGQGKSSVITPLLAVMLSEQGGVTIAAPEALIDMSTHFVHNALALFFSRRVVRFDFSRHTLPANDDLMRASLRAIHAKLRRAERRKGVVVSTAAAIKSTLLKFIELLGAYKDNSVGIRKGTVAAESAGALEAVLSAGQWNMDSVTGTSGADRAKEMRKETLRGSQRRFGTKASRPDAGESAGIGAAKGATEPGEQVQVHSTAAAAAENVQLGKLQAIEELRAILRLWGNGTLLLDEVDLLLHPLRSELNYPTGHMKLLELTAERCAIGLRLLNSILAAAQVVIAKGARSEGRAEEQQKGAGERELEEQLRTGLSTHALQLQPHIILVDKGFYPRLVPAFVELLVPWLRAQCDRPDAMLEKLELNPAGAWADSCKPSKKGKESEEGTFSAGQAIAQTAYFSERDGFTQRFWCSDENVNTGNAIQNWYVKLPMRRQVGAVHIAFKERSDFPFFSGLLMVASEVHIYLSDDGGETYTRIRSEPEFVERTIYTFQGQECSRSAASATTCPWATHVRVELIGVARWFALQTVEVLALEEGRAIELSDDEIALVLHSPSASAVATISRARGDDDAAVASLVARLALLPIQLRKVLELSRSYIHTFLPHALSKINCVSFGLLPSSRVNMDESEGRRLLAVPYVGKDQPSASSEFTHPNVQVMLTVMAYLVQGLRLSDMRQLLSLLKDRLARERGPVRRRPSQLNFASWVEAAREAQHARGHTRATGTNSTSTSTSANVNANASGLPLNLVRPELLPQLQQLHSLLRKHPGVVEYYLREWVFPRCLKLRAAKYRATGEELGGTGLFARRLGFSGTPSSLLPLDLGACIYERGSEGQVIHTLADPAVVRTKRLGADWSAQSILALVAGAQIGKNQDGNDEEKEKEEERTCYHALIDTGALITGMSNLEAARFLLELLPGGGAGAAARAAGAAATDEVDRPADSEGSARGHGAAMQGVVFLDENDTKCILTRGAREAVPLASSSIPADRRFTYYDHAHTTGMDIKQTPLAVAAITLGKDMTLRDYAQGAWRMRGLGNGQTLCMIVTPQVANIIHRVVTSSNNSSAGGTGGGAGDATTRASDGLQCDALAWLVTRSVSVGRIEESQLRALQLQSVWRQPATQYLLRPRAGGEHALRSLIDGVPATAAAASSSIDGEEGVKTAAAEEGAEEGAEEEMALFASAQATFKMDTKFDIAEWDTRQKPPTFALRALRQCESEGREWLREMSQQADVLRIVAAHERLTGLSADRQDSAGAGAGAGADADFEVAIPPVLASAIESVSPTKTKGAQVLPRLRQSLLDRDAMHSARSRSSSGGAGTSHDSDSGRSSNRGDAGSAAIAAMQAALEANEMDTEVQNEKEAEEQKAPLLQQDAGAAAFNAKPRIDEPWPLVQLGSAAMGWMGPTPTPASTPASASASASASAVGEVTNVTDEAGVTDVAILAFCHSLRNFRFTGLTCGLDCHAAVLLSENFAPRVCPDEEDNGDGKTKRKKSRRLKNLGVLMHLCMPADESTGTGAGAGAGRVRQCVAALSLREAESLRWIVHHEPAALQRVGAPSFALVNAADGLVLAAYQHPPPAPAPAGTGESSASDISADLRKAVAGTGRDRVFEHADKDAFFDQAVALLRFFDNNCEFTTEEQAHLAEALSRVPAPTRLRFFSDTGRARKRDRNRSTAALDAIFSAGGGR
jgi:hypothetical protein